MDRGRSGVAPWMASAHFVRLNERRVDDPATLANLSICRRGVVRGLELQRIRGIRSLRQRCNGQPDYVAVPARPNVSGLGATWVHRHILKCRDIPVIASPPSVKSVECFYVGFLLSVVRV